MTVFGFKVMKQDSKKHIVTQSIHFIHNLYAVYVGQNYGQERDAMAGVI